MNTQLLALTIAGTALFASNLSARPEGPPPPPDPETVVVEMLTGYDADENDSLNQDELVAAFTGLRQKHQAARQGDRPRVGRRCPDGQAPADRPMKPRQGKRRGPPAPESIAPQLIEDFDTNGDAELNTEELLSALTELHERGRRGMPPPRDPAPEDAE